MGEYKLGGLKALKFFATALDGKLRVRMVFSSVVIQVYALPFFFSLRILFSAGLPLPLHAQDSLRTYRRTVATCVCVLQASMTAA